MKIGILLHPYGENRPAGLARTIFEYTKGMLEVDDKNEYIIFVKNKPRIPPTLPGKNWQLYVLGGGMLWLEKLRNAPRADAYIFNTPIMPLSWRPPKSIVIALDFAYWYLSSLTLRGQLVKYATYLYNLFSLLKADHIVAVSHDTKEETIKLFKILERKITVVYCGYKKICALQEEKIKLPEKFILFVGVIKPRKNPFNVAKAFYVFHKKHKEYSLVVVGSGGGTYYDAIIEFTKARGLEHKVVFPGFVTDNNLSYIYKRAQMFVFPTLIDGLGQPVLEAMDCGIPVITSNQSGLKEAGGNNSALLVDPYNSDDIARAMRDIVERPGLRERLIQSGILQSKRFSWQKAGREMLVVVTQTLNSKS